MNIPTITFLGTRGTIPVDGPQVMKYGGATSCIYVHMGGQCIVLDGGSGLLTLPDVIDANQDHIHLLLSHPHVDHMMGIPVCASFYSGKQHITLYASPRQGLGAQAMVTRMMSEPLWPVEPTIFPSMSFVDLAEDFCIGPVHIRMIDGPHPGGCTIFRLDCDGKSLVYATDIELDEQSFAMISDFARDCSLLLIDGQYTDDELPSKHSFGHSSWQQALQLAQASGVKRLGIIHHDPARTDEDLDHLQHELQMLFPSGFFARGGEVVTL